eukprot:jgi/Tetstr1/446521/TSEL_034047.t2
MEAFAEAVDATILATVKRVLGVFFDPSTYGTDTHPVVIDFPAEFLQNQDDLDHAAADAAILSGDAEARTRSVRQPVLLGNTVLLMDELKNMVPNLELSLPAFDVDTVSYDSQSLKPTLPELKTIRHGVKYIAVPWATNVDRFERGSILGDMQRGLAVRGLVAGVTGEFTGGHELGSPSPSVAMAPARSPENVLLALFICMLTAYTVLLSRRAGQLEAQLSSSDEFASYQQDVREDQIRQLRRVNLALKESEELLGDSALLSSDVVRLTQGLSQAVEYEISHAQLAAPESGVQAPRAVAQRSVAEQRQAASAAARAQTQAQRMQQAHGPNRQQPMPDQPPVPSEVHKWLRDCKDTPARQQHVKNAMQHAWDSYVKYAWGMDELQPLSKKGKSSFGGLGATIIDALDTLHIMGLTSRFEQAKEFVVNLNFDKNFDASVFETTIRVVGGLLSAHDLTGEAIFLQKTQQLVDILLHAFNTPTGIPWNQLNLHTHAGKNPGWTAKMSTLAEFGTEQMEFFMLSAKTGKHIYREKAQHCIQFLHDKHGNKGLLPIYINPATGEFSTQQVSFGAMGDSYYEYLLKVWILFGKNDDMFHDMWERSMDEMLERLIHKTTPSGFTYVAELSRSGALVHKMDHLACFVPAMLALGVHHKAVTGPKADRYLQVAKELTDTCFQMYKLSPSGLAPEYIEARPGKDFVTNPRAQYNLQRPEAVEAFFVMYRVTGDPKYQEYGWEVFSAFETFTKVDVGYTGVRDVTKTPIQRDDAMQSFWLAETLKYMYLLFSPKDKLDLDEWVLNTEAHPLKVHPWKYEPAAGSSDGAGQAGAAAAVASSPRARLQGRRAGHP